jgi:cytochrome P450
MFSLLFESQGLTSSQSYLKQAKTVIETQGVPSEKDAPTILDAIYTSPTLGPEDKTLLRLLVEAQNVIGAGTETTGNTLSNFTYHVIAQPSITKRLKDELQEAASQSQSSGLMDYRTLERLPYLKACVKEALRLATGVSSRIPRSSRTETVTYRTPTGESYVFPPGAVISMSMLDLHYNEDIFVDAKTFKPERWLDNSKDKLQEMEKAFVPFSRGTRQCVGSELAKQELT